MNVNGSCNICGNYYVKKMDIKVIFTEGGKYIKFYYFCILTKIAKPFLRWAIEKTQLIGAIEQSLPVNIK